MIQVLTCGAMSYQNYESGKSWEIDGEWLHIRAVEKLLASFRVNEVVFVQEKQT